MSEPIEVDLEVSRKWGLLATPKTRLKKEDSLETTLHLKHGGL
jgi:hypothetical protein